MHQIAIRREDKNNFERRVSLTPPDLKRLIHNQQLRAIVQPSPRRIFGDEAYAKAGAQLNEDLDDCGVIIGVKEVPLKLLSPRKTYVFFSHTIKGQPNNMPLLKRILEQGCTLIDYERIVDAQGRRLIFFGRHAGLAGMIDALWSLGQRLRLQGIQTPFAAIKQAYHYTGLQQAKNQIRKVGQQLQQQALPAVIQPLVFGITGYGNVATGAQEILDLLAPQTISPAELTGLERGSNGLYKVVFREDHLFAPHRGSFDLQEYYQSPDRYHSVFDRYWPHLSVLMNCIYWEPDYPRLVTRRQLQAVHTADQSRLIVIGDITCDIGGSIEMTLRATEPDNPVYVYDVHQDRIIDGFLGEGPVILAVDNLPAELPREASGAFSTALRPFVPALAAADYTAPFARCMLPDPIRRAVIVYQGELTEDYRYLDQYL